jgi:hypothetical protein
MASDYPGKIVLIGYFLDKKNAGDREKRTEWSEELFELYDDLIVAACKAGGLKDPSEEARAIMAVMATRAPGTGDKAKAGNAVAAYLAYRGL